MDTKLAGNTFESFVEKVNFQTNDFHLPSIKESCTNQISDPPSLGGLTT